MGKPSVGRLCPSSVKVEIRIDLGHIPIREVRRDWDALRPHDVLFLGHVNQTLANVRAQSRDDSTFIDRYNVEIVRGGEIIEIVDASGTKLDESKLGRPDFQPLKGTVRFFRLLVDENQFYTDMRHAAQSNMKTESDLGVALLYPNMSQSAVTANWNIFAADNVTVGQALSDDSDLPSFASYTSIELPQTNVTGAIDMYQKCNILMRRRPEENNFRAVLSTIRDCMHEQEPLPSWLNDLLLGYGDPAAASASAMQLASKRLEEDKVVSKKKLGGDMVCSRMF